MGENREGFFDLNDTLYGPEGFDESISLNPDMHETHTPIVYCG